MIIETVKKTSQFYVILVCFVVSYFIFLMLTTEEDYLAVFKTSYTVTLGDMVYDDLSFVRFLIYVVFTTAITLVMMNLLVSILGDAYELVTSEKKYYDGRAKLHRSLVYERLLRFISKVFRRDTELPDEYIFASIPYNFGDEGDNDDEGMIGKILYSARMNHKENQEKIDAIQE